MNDYPTFLDENVEPFDPLELARATEEICCHEDCRKYTEFYCTGVYGGISTGYLVGCCLRCVFCWVDLSREFPRTHGDFYSPHDVFDRLTSNAEKAGVNKLRVSGGEPTLGREHLLGLLELTATTDYLFVLETNGILLGADRVYAKKLKDFRHLHVRVSLKAGTREGFEKRTGGRSTLYDFPYKAIEYLQEAGVSFHVAAMTDPRIMSQAERKEMLRKLKEIHYVDYLEEEVIDPYETSVIRLEKAGLRIF